MGGTSILNQTPSSLELYVDSKAAYSKLTKLVSGFKSDKCLNAICAEASRRITMLDKEFNKPLHDNTEVHHAINREEKYDNICKSIADLYCVAYRYSQIERVK